MSTNPVTSVVSPQPVRRQSPWPAVRGNERVSTPPAYTADPKYKKYTQQVEKCLSSFDNVHEWADFISFLKQLLKTFEAYEQFKEIPRKLVVAKRLSQCLNPALPTGVHQRALDVYSHVFAVLGTEGLQRDLAIWSLGLFPFFEYAATSVKPALLNLFDTYYLPLQSGLRPVMKSFILALLPGLEEETGEFFDKVLGLLDRISGTVSPSFFFQNIWLVMLTTPSARGTSLNFLSRRLPKLKADEDITHIVGRDVGLMIRAFSASLEDDDLLVRRGALDLLLQSLRIDGVAIKRAAAEDRTILMRAAISVVLRRDLSLNRRLYSWLLGPEENNERQMAYFKTHALDLLRTTLKDEMFEPSADYAPSRPFKIFISLLDKWEIGSPLTEILVYDAFRAIRKTTGSSCDFADDLSMTASTLYEAVEPRLLWRQLFSSLLTDLDKGSEIEGCRMIRYILTNLHVQDAEIETIHLPVVFSANLELLSIRLRASPAMSFSSAREILELQEEILKHVPSTFTFTSRPQLSVESVDVWQDPLSFASKFYGLDPQPSQRTSSSPFSEAFEDLVNLSIFSAENTLANHSEVSQEVLVRSLRILSNLIDRLVDAQDLSIAINWDPQSWLSTQLSCLDNKAVSFAAVDTVISTVVKLHHLHSIEQRLSIDTRSTVSSMVRTLLQYLRLPWAAYHNRAVSLLWSVDSISRSRHVEAVISQKLSSRNAQVVEECCEEFGVLWRLTDDEFVPGFRLKLPMMIVLDTLRSSEPRLRRVGETWMRCNLRSYLRVLDPIMFDLADPAIRRSPSMMVLNGKELQGFSYDRSFDQRYTNHSLEILLSIVKFGGQGFSKVARGTLVSRSSYPEISARLQSVSATFPDATYMDVLLHLLLKFVESEPNPILVPSMGPFNIISQSLAVDLLQAIVARGEVDAPVLQTIESAVVKKLYASIHSSQLDLQNKLLHLLHSVISASHVEVDARSGKIKGSRGQDDDSISDAIRSSKPGAYTIHPLLVQTLLDGIAKPSNRPILQHWLDFVLMTIPQYQISMTNAVVPLSDGVCRQLRLCLVDAEQASNMIHSGIDIESITTDNDFVMLVTALERLVLLSLAQISDGNQPGDEISSPEKPVQESSGLLGYVSNVFGSDASGVPDDHTSVQSSDYRSLQEAVRVLYDIWIVLGEPDRQAFASVVYPKSRLRCRKVLEHFFRAHSSEVLEYLVDCWHREPSEATFDIVDILASSAQNVVHMLCESISNRIPGMMERSKRPVILLNLTDLVIFDFLERYIDRLEGPLALQIWGRFMQLIKDLLSAVREFKNQVFSTLRCFTVLADKVSQTTAMEDRRMRKELQDAYSKLLDLCVLVSRPYDQNSWIRRAPRDTLTVNGRESPLSRAASDTKIDEKMNVSSTSLPDAVKPSYSGDMAEQIYSYISSNVLPNLRKFLVDNDKILAACNSIVSNVVGPAVKGKNRPLDVEDNVLSVLQEMARIGAAVKAWRVPVTDALYDNRCFNSTPGAGSKWRPMFKSLFDIDKTALAELLGKITTAPSANIFTNREYEMLLRSLNLRRLSYVLLSAEKNHFLAQLPSIQEKLVDTLRNVSAPIVQSEVYLCVRVLLCRLSPHNLSSFWPVILTELYRLFDQTLTSVPTDGSEEVPLILAACKLLDLLLVLQTEEFQIHQWIFITDTVDAVYRPDDWFPNAMLDHLAEATASLPVSEDRVRSQPTLSATPTVESRPMRRPMLQSLRQIDSIRDLVPFFSGASITSFESVYNSGGNVDWEAVEQSLLGDMFEGR